MKKIIMIPFLLFLLTACQATGPVEENEVKETKEEIEAENNENKEGTESEEEESIDYSLYDDVTSEYSDYTTLSLEEAENTQFAYAKYDTVYYFFDQDLYAGMSATRYDINNDGIENLIIALQLIGDESFYSMLDIYTIEDNEPVSLFDDDLSSYIGLKRTGITLLDNGDIVYETVANMGTNYGSIYVLNEDGLGYDKTSISSDEEGNYDVIEGALENKLDLASLTWDKIDHKSIILDDLKADDFSHLTGTWKNNEGDELFIDGKQFTNESGHESTLVLSEYYDEEEPYISLTVKVEGDDFPPTITFYPKNIEIDLGRVLKSDLSKDRLTIAYQGAPGEEDVYYKIND